MAHIVGEAWTRPNPCPNGHEIAVRVQARWKPRDETKPCARGALTFPMPPFPPQVDSFRFLIIVWLFVLSTIYISSIISAFWRWLPDSNFR